MSNSSTKLLSKPYSTDEKALMEEAVTLMDKLEKVCLKLEAPLFISMVSDSKPDSTSYTTKILSAALFNSTLADDRISRHAAVELGFNIDTSDTELTPFDNRLVSAPIIDASSDSNNS